MSRSEFLEIFEKVSANAVFFKADEVHEKVWYEVLCNFVYEDAMKNLEILLKDEKFRMNPNVYEVIKGLTPIDKKVDFGKVVVYCPICKRAVNQSEEAKHRERCQSIRYLVKQYKKWTGKDLAKRSLWEMSEEKFQEKYDRFLHYILEHTEDKHEKMRIDFIFNPPRKEVAKRFLGIVD